MSSIKECMQCSKTNGDVYTCEACHGCFCFNHLIQHREDLSVKLDELGQQCDMIQNDLDNQSNNIEDDPMFAQINEWERESIIKILVIASVARDDLKRQLATRNDQLKLDFTELMARVRNYHDLNCSENELTQCFERLKEFREMFETIPSMLELVHDLEIAPVDFIRVVNGDDTDVELETSADTLMTYEQSIDDENSFHSTDNSTTISTEHFEAVMGDVQLSDNNLLATKFGTYSASICGSNLYTTGTHEIRFRIELLSNNSIFVGIIPSTQQMTRTAFKLPTVYGWWDVNFPVLRGVQNVNGVYSTKSGDEVTLTLACNERKLVYNNSRCGSKKISVNISVCPFPWQILVVLGSGENAVRIVI